MQLSGEHIAGGFGLVFAAMLAWFGALWLNLQGANLWFARLSIFLLLALAVVAIVWWLHNRKKNTPAGEASGNSEGVSSPGATDDILLILREAEARVASSTQLPRGTRLSSLPVIFLVGGSSSGKTCVATQSGLDPELISGQVYQEGNIAPTRLANVWFARKAIFVEMGGKTLGDANLWNRLLHRVSPGKLRSIFSGKPASPRAAVVCYDSTRLAKAASPEEIIAESRGIRARLEQISQTLGISFPVYVLFTQADRLPYFDEFFRNLSDSEITQVLGVTLSPFPSSASGVYAEQESKRLTTAFNSMFYSLAECRPGLLYRERNADKLPGIYEFPRELQKRIPVATQFLVDLCRPSHLRSGPFLRGFYFTGIRQVETAAPLGGTVIASKTSLMPARSFSANATSLMRADDFTRTQSQAWQSATQAGFARESGKTPQWLFLSHIFSHVILQDRTALGASGSSSRANVWKRALLATVGALAAIWFLGLIISYFGNRALQQDVLTAGEAISPIKPQSASMASLEDLQRLEAARVQLRKLAEYDRHGAPLHLRWGLYSGKSLYENFRPLYFGKFKNLLFADVQNQMASFLHNRPPSPANPSDDDYSVAYNTLKAYLMTTLKPEKTDAAFLSQFLLSKWSGPFDSPEQNRLAREQFAFYANELRIDNPFPSNDDPLVLQSVEQSRRYLTAFTGATFVYKGYLDKVRQTCKCEPLNFSRRYPDAEGVVRESKTIDPAFTKEGWKIMQSLVSHTDWRTDDEWVLGLSMGEALTRGGSTVDVKNQYESDYIREWREYVKSASLVPLGDSLDASKKLGKLTENRSPLLELLCEVSENTSGTSENIAKAFQAVNDVIKAPCYNLLVQDTGAKPYLGALNEFKMCIDKYQYNPASPGTQLEDAYNSCKTQQWPPVLKAASDAVKVVDHEANLDQCVVSLLKFDVLKLDVCSLGKVKPPPPSDVFCLALNRLSSKYPFRPDSGDEATLQDFEDFFRPGTGVLSREISSGGEGKGGSRASLLRLAENIQRSLYPSGSSVLQYQFVITTTVPAGLKSAQLNLEATPLKVAEGAANTQSFTWPGKTHEAELKVGDSTYYGPFAGPWAVFRLLGSYNWSTVKGGYSLVSPQLKGPKESPFQDTLELKAQGVPLFRRGYLSQLRCSAQPHKH